MESIGHNFIWSSMKSGPVTVHANWITLPCHFLGGKKGNCWALFYFNVWTKNSKWKIKKRWIEKHTIYWINNRETILYILKNRLQQRLLSWGLPMSNPIFFGSWLTSWITQQWQKTSQCLPSFMATSIAKHKGPSVTWVWGLLGLQTVRWCKNQSFSEMDRKLNI